MRIVYLASLQARRPSAPACASIMDTPTTGNACAATGPDNCLQLECKLSLIYQLTIEGIEPSRIDFLTSVGIGIRFLLKCRFSVGISIGFGMKKVVGFLSVFFLFFSDLYLSIFIWLTLTGSAEYQF
jgi:hypothetical protein